METVTAPAPAASSAVSSSPKNKQQQQPQLQPQAQSEQQNQQTPEEQKLETKESKQQTDSEGHKLETEWSFSFSKKLPTKSANFTSYESSLVRLGKFSTVEGFWKMYTNMVSPDDLPRDYDIHMFRGQLTPAWESFPNGGCWILKVHKRNGLVTRLWEELLFACIGEHFEEPDLVGVVLSTRLREDIISVWNSNNTNNQIRFRIGEKLKQILNLDESTQIEYKFHSTSLRDRSTFRNAKAYVYAATQAKA